jgi:hypothetical protein
VKESSLSDGYNEDEEAIQIDPKIEMLSKVY